uniref:Uncharacterized protein n=1 Tax=Oryza sativa subsp. japonica TaxID=39947 RepID=Q6Z7C4_ORYSJ|nr:hypothetical protein [Oryza sativa Japonica Group]BAD07924.1 hypothetical protein [Oryza sativa Japonica Group]
MPYRPWPTSPPRLAAWERNKGTTVTRERNNSSGAAVEDSGGGRGKAHSRGQNWYPAIPISVAMWPLEICPDPTVKIRYRKVVATCKYLNREIKLI